MDVFPDIYSVVNRKTVEPIDAARLFRPDVQI